MKQNPTVELGSFLETFLEHSVNADYSVNASRPSWAGCQPNAKSEFFFIQVGAFGSSASDLISPMVRRYRWCGAIVEPQPQALEELQKSYADVPNLEFFPVAIGSEEGTLKLYSRTNRSNPKPRITKHLMGLRRRAYDDDAEFDVPCWTLNRLVEEAGTPKQIDLLQVHTSGNDYQVLQSIDLNRYRPKMIRYEHALLNARDANGCLEMLADNGYRIILEDRDTLAIATTRVQAAAA